MARCSGCSGDRCSCKIVAGANVVVTGAGTTANPYIIEAGAGGGGGGGATGRLTGEIIAYGGPTAPAGWLVCDGSTVSRVTYAALFAVTGTSYGPGDGANTFHLPDIAGRFPIGADGNYPRGSSGGQTTVTLTLANVPQHSHTINHSHSIAHDHVSFSSGAGGAHDHGATNKTVAGQGTHGHAAFDTSDGGAHEHDHPARHSEAGGSEGQAYKEGVAAPGGQGIPPEGLHHHNINVPDGSGGHRHDLEIAVSATHVHSVDVPAFTGDSGAPSVASTGLTGNGSPDPLSTLPPYTSVTYLIKT